MTVARRITKISDTYLCLEKYGSLEKVDLSGETVDF
jgi:hypothetical protein